jgi:murein DD-endopeptidase MepM/ murein hydrolase activator NlpD
MTARDWVDAAWRPRAMAVVVAVAALGGALHAVRVADRAAADRETEALRQRLAEKRRLVHRLQDDLTRVAAAADRVAELASVARGRDVEVRRLAGLEGDREPNFTPEVAADAAHSEEASRVLSQLAFLEGELGATTDSLALMTSLVSPRPAPHATPARAPAVEPGFLAGLPVAGEITSGFGWRWSPLGDGSKRHTGIDIRAGFGTPVAASGAGVVAFAGRDSGGYGWTVVIDHDHDVRTLYGHLSAIYVRAGQKVVRGNPVGAVGASGRATGVHLHYEVRVRDVPVDPMRFARGQTPAVSLIRDTGAVRPVARVLPIRAAQ